MANISHFTQTVNGISTTYDIHDANAIPRSGGAVMTGTALSRNVDDSDFRIDGGSDWDKGGSVVVYGKDRPNENGKVVIYASNGSNRAYYSFYPDGYVTLGSNFSFNTDVTFQIGSSGGLYTLLRYDGMIWSNSNKLFPANNLIMGLGDADHKWATLNGINPGALSLPSNNAVNILSELQSDGYIAPSNGYVRAIKNVRTECASTFGIRNETTGIEDRRITERQFLLVVIVPVQAGEKVIISDNWNSVSDATVTYGAYFYPCQGNV